MQDYVVEEPRPSPPVSDSLVPGLEQSSTKILLPFENSVYTLYSILDSLRLSLQALWNIWELPERKFWGAN